MILIRCAFAFLLIGFIYSCKSNRKNDAVQKRMPDSLLFTLEKIADSLYAPLAIEHSHDGSGRLFIGEQAGVIRIFENGKVIDTPFLDIRKKLVPIRNEYMDVGLLGFAFHPDYKNNGRFFVHYSAPSNKGSDNTSVLAEGRVSLYNPNRASDSLNILLEVEQPESNHNGGNIIFDKEGYLYIGFGDGGGQGDVHGKVGNGQDMEQLLGKILRIDVNHQKPYSIPPDNPFVNKPGRDEIWSYGFRMPWRISFDRATGELFCADVGQDQYEEVNIVTKGKNYGWRAMEGFHIYDSLLFTSTADYELPIAEYKHPEGVSVTGGYVYRGKQYPDLNGIYLFADWAFKMFFLSKDTDGKWIKYNSRFEGKDDNKFSFRINSFGEDEGGEIYIAVQEDIGAISPTGAVYKIGLKNQK